jgi:hypothetical protein
VVAGGVADLLRVDQDLERLGFGPARRQDVDVDRRAAADPRNVALFGVVNLVAVIARLTVSGFASVWCGWAAVSSAAITLHCRFARPRTEHAGSEPDGLISAG